MEGAYHILFYAAEPGKTGIFEDLRLQKNVMQPRSQQQMSRSAAQEVPDSHDSLPQELANRLSQARDWPISLGSEDAGAMYLGQINNMELDGEWFGDADPSVILQAKVMRCPEAFSLVRSRAKVELVTCRRRSPFFVQLFYCRCRWCVGGTRKLNVHVPLLHLRLLNC